MSKDSPVLRQFITIICCKNKCLCEVFMRNMLFCIFASLICMRSSTFIFSVNISLPLLQIGNLLTLSCSLSDGWITINYIELQSENVTLSTGPLKSEKLPLVISISSIGGIVGNFAIVPISRAIGIKHAIHLFALPLIVCEA